jgi:purine-binding chemotaxis protein CheW
MGEAAAVRSGGEQVRLLFFRCCGERFALDVAYVREILPPQEPTPVPFVPETVAGIINHRGTIYTLVRFSLLAGFPGDRAGGVVLLRLPDMAVGITVDEIEGIENVSGRLLADAGPPGAGATDVPFLRRSADERGRLVHAVDADVLIDTIYQLPDLARPGEG